MGRSYFQKYFPEPADLSNNGRMMWIDTKGSIRQLEKIGEDITLRVYCTASNEIFIRGFGILPWEMSI